MWGCFEIVKNFGVYFGKNVVDFGVDSDLGLMSPKHELNMMMVAVAVHLTRMGLDANPLKLHLIEASKGFGIHFENFERYFEGYFGANLVCFGYQYEIMTYCRYFDYYLCFKRERGMQ